MLEPYIDIIYRECEQRLDQYLSRTGKFANYTDDIIIKWENIKDDISDKDFIYFPLEKLKIKFSIKHTPNSIYDKPPHGDSNTSFSGLAAIISGHRDSSKWIKSESNIVEKSLLAKINIELLIGPKNSVNMDKMKNDLKSTITHELFHMFDYSRNKKISPPIEQVMNSNTLNYGVELGDEIVIPWGKLPFMEDIFHYLYTLSDTEIHAVISQYKNTKKDLRFYELPKLDIEIVLNETKKWFLQNYTEKAYDDYFKNFGNEFYHFHELIIKEFFIPASRQEKEIWALPKDVYKKIKGKNLKEGFELLTDIINKRYDHLRRKVDKINLP